MQGNAPITCVAIFLRVSITVRRTCLSGNILLSFTENPSTKTFVPGISINAAPLYSCAKFNAVNRPFWPTQMKTHPSNTILKKATCFFVTVNSACLLHITRDPKQYDDLDKFAAQTKCAHTSTVLLIQFNPIHQNFTVVQQNPIYQITQKTLECTMAKDKCPSYQHRLIF